MKVILHLKAIHAWPDNIWMVHGYRLEQETGRRPSIWRQQVEVMQIVGGYAQVDISNFSRGVYVVKFLNESTAEAGKLIKK